MKKIVILGAGPAGLGAAYRLHELGYEDFTVLEARGGPGGLASSEKSRNGFIYDIGGHVLFSHFRYFDELFDRMLGNEYQELLRESWIWMRDRFLPYPFQNNVKYLPKEDVLACVLGILEAQKKGATEFANFEELIQGVFGPGIGELFMMPYNFKVWAHPPKMMGTRWIGERVPVVDLARVLTNVILDKDDISWGPNNTFKYPRHGGTGGLFTRIADSLSGRIRYASKVVGVDPVKKRVLLADDTDVDYDVLISTQPVDLLVKGLTTAPAEVREATKHLLHSGSAIVGVGVKQPCPSKKCWMYFPEPSSPFYRVTYLSNYSPEVVPDATRYYSLLAEVSRSPYKPVNLETVVDEVLDGMVATKLLSKDDLDDVVDTHLIARDYTYPIPSIRRDEALSVIQPWLLSQGIYSRGRFGSWKYEIGNMDHAVQMGAECAEHVVNGAQELCVNDVIPKKEDQTLRLLPQRWTRLAPADLVEQETLAAAGR
jgi:UDP-galactopyranose mutase